MARTSDMGAGTSALAAAAMGGGAISNVARDAFRVTSGSAAMRAGMASGTSLADSFYKEEAKLRDLLEGQGKLQDLWKEKVRVQDIWESQVQLHDLRDEQLRLQDIWEEQVKLVDLWDQRVELADIWDDRVTLRDLWDEQLKLQDILDEQLEQHDRLGGQMQTTPAWLRDSADVASMAAGLGAYEPGWMASMVNAGAIAAAALPDCEPGWMAASAKASDAMFAGLRAAGQTPSWMSSLSAGALGAGIVGAETLLGGVGVAPDQFSIGGGLAAMAGARSASLSAMFGSTVDGAALGSSAFGLINTGLSLAELARMPMVDSVTDLLGRYRSPAVDALEATSLLGHSLWNGAVPSMGMLAGLGSYNPGSVLDAIDWARPVGGFTAANADSALVVPAAPPDLVPTDQSAESVDFMWGVAMGVQAFRQGGVGQLKRVGRALKSTAAVTTYTVAGAGAVMALLRLDNPAITKALVDGATTLAYVSFVMACWAVMHRRD